MKKNKNSKEEKIRKQRFWKRLDKELLKKYETRF